MAAAILNAYSCSAINSTIAFINDNTTNYAGDVDTDQAKNDFTDVTTIGTCNVGLATKKTLLSEDACGLTRLILRKAHKWRGCQRLSKA